MHDIHVHVTHLYPRRGAILLDLRVGTLLEEEEEEIHMFDDADDQFFKSILNSSEHTLHHYMPQHTRLSHCRNLRPCKHNHK